MVSTRLLILLRYFPIGITHKFEHILMSFYTEHKIIAWDICTFFYMTTSKVSGGVAPLFWIGEQN